MKLCIFQRSWEGSIVESVLDPDQILKRVYVSLCEITYHSINHSIAYSHTSMLAVLLQSNFSVFPIDEILLLLTIPSLIIHSRKKIENFENFQKNSKSQLTWLHKGKNRFKNFLLHFWSQNDSIRKKKQKKNFSTFFNFFDPRGWPYDVIRMECAPIEGQGPFFSRGDLYGWKGL